MSCLAIPCGCGGDAASATLQSVRCAAVGNLTIATDLEAGDLVDGVTLAAGDFVLLPHQTTRSEIGIYRASVSGAAVRAPGWTTAADHQFGRRVAVREGDYYGPSLWELRTQGPTIGVSEIRFLRTDRTRHDPAQSLVQVSDFSTGAAVWVLGGAGGGSCFDDVTHGSDGIHVAELFQQVNAAGSVAFARAAMPTAIDWYFSTGGPALFSAVAYVFSLPDVVQDFAWRIGLGDNDGGDYTDGWYFELQQDGSGNPQWVGKTANNAVRSLVVLETSPHQQWTHLEARQAQNGTRVDFFIDRVLRGNLTTNIPTARRARLEVSMEKIAGASAAEEWLDFFHFVKEIVPIR